MQHGRLWRVPDTQRPVHAQGLMEFAEEPHGPGGWEDDLDCHFALGWDIHVKALLGKADIMQSP